MAPESRTTRRTCDSTSIGASEGRLQARLLTAPSFQDPVFRVKRPERFGKVIERFDHWPGRARHAWSRHVQAEEPAMQPTQDVRRYADGSIDFDFYRRQAARRQRLARRVLILRWVNHLSGLVSALGSLVARTARHLWPRPPATARFLRGKPQLAR